MAQGIWLKAGGGVTSDDVTATINLIVQGYTTVTADSNDEVVNGTLPNMPSQTSPISWRFDNGKAYVKIQKGAYIQESTPSGGAEIIIPFEWIRAHIPSQSVLNNAVIFGKRGEIEDKGDGNLSALNIGTNGGDSVFANFPNGYYHNASGRPYIWLRWTDLARVLGLDGSKWLQGYSAAGVNGTIPSYQNGQTTDLIGTNGGDSIHCWVKSGYHPGENGHAYMWLPWDKLRGVLGLDASKMLDTLNICGVRGQIPRWISSTGGVISAWNGEGHAWDDTIAGRGRGIISRIPDGYKIEGADWTFLPSPNLYPQNIVKDVNINGVIGSRNYIDQIANSSITGDYTFRVSQSTDTVTFNDNWYMYNTLIVGIDLVGKDIKRGGYLRTDKGGRYHITTLALSKNASVETWVVSDDGAENQFSLRRSGTQLFVTHTGNYINNNTTLNIYVKGYASAAFDE